MLLGVLSFSSVVLHSFLVWGFGFFGGGIIFVYLLLYNFIDSERTAVIKDKYVAYA